MMHQQTMPNVVNPTIKLTIFSTQGDRIELGKINNILKPLGRDLKDLDLKVWDIDLIPTGDIRSQAKQEALVGADLIVLLISINFLNDSELVNLIKNLIQNERDCLVFILNLCKWEITFETEQRFMDIVNADKPLSGFQSTHQQNELINKLCDKILVKARKIQAEKIQVIRQRQFLDQFAQTNQQAQAPALPPPSTKNRLVELAKNYPWVPVMIIVFVLIVIIAILIGGNNSKVPNNAIATVSPLPLGSAQSFPTPEVATKSAEDPAGIVAVAWSPDGNTAVYGSGDKIVGLVVPSGKMTKIADYNQGLSTVAWSQDGSLVAAAGRDNTVKIFKADGTLVTTLTDFTNWIFALAWSPNNTLAIGAGNNILRLVKTDGSVRDLKHSDKVLRIAWSTDGKLIASGSLDGFVRVWRVDDGKEIDSKKSKEGRVSDVTWLESNILAVSSWDGLISLWNENDHWQSFGKDAFYGRANKVAWSPDKTTLAVAYQENVVILWKFDGKDIKSLKEFKKLEGHNQDVYSIAWSADGSILASGSWDNTVRYWDKDGNSIPVDIKHNDRINSVAWSKNDILISASEDDTVRFWDKKGQPVKGTT